MPSRLGEAARQAARAAPLLVVCALLLATGVDILPGESLVGAGPVLLTPARLLILAGLVAIVWVELIAPRGGLRRRPDVPAAPAPSALFRTGLEIPLALLLIAGLVATLKWDTGARYRFLVESIALFYLAFALVRARPAARTALAAVALVAVALAALPGVAQVAQHEPTGFYREGSAPVEAPPPEVPPGTVTRATGTFANPNVLAGHVLLLGPLAALAALALARTLELRLALGLAVALAYLGLVLAFSRSATFLAAGGLALAPAIARGRAPSARQLAAGGAALAALAVALVLLLGAGGGVAGYGRADAWRETVSAIGDNPAYGVGLGRIGDVLGARDPSSSVAHAHNLPLNWWAEAGPAALVAWLWILAALLVWSARGALGGDRTALAALVALAGFAGFSLLDHPANVDRVATAFWVVAAIAAASRPPPRPLRERFSALSRRRGAGAVPSAG